MQLSLKGEVELGTIVVADDDPDAYADNDKVPAEGLPASFTTLPKSTGSMTSVLSKLVGTAAIFHYAFIIMLGCIVHVGMYCLVLGAATTLRVLYGEVVGSQDLESFLVDFATFGLLVCLTWSLQKLFAAWHV